MSHLKPPPLPEQLYTEKPPNGLDLILEESRQLGAIKRGDFSAIAHLNLRCFTHMDSTNRRALMQRFSASSCFRKLADKTPEFYNSIKLENGPNLSNFKALLEGISRLAAHNSFDYFPAQNIYNNASPLTCATAMENAGKHLAEAYDVRKIIAARSYMPLNDVETALQEIASQLLMCKNHLQDDKVFTRAF